MCCPHYHWRGWASSLITSFLLCLSLTKIACITFGKGFLIHHICSWFGPICDLLYLEVQNLLWSIFPRYLQKNSPSCYVLLISKAKELKYQQLCFHTDICCNFSKTELHFFFCILQIWHKNSSSFVKRSSDIFKSLPNVANVLWNLELPWSILKYATFPFL